MPVPPEFHAFWSAAQAANPAIDAARFYEAFAFGDGARMADELAKLVLAGTKRATASLVWSYEVENKPRPKPGDLSIVIAGSGTPLCIIETTAVDVVPFDDVTEDFAAAEGEDGGTLAAWRRGHAAYFARECARIGREPNPRMEVLCERFRVVHRPAESNHDTELRALDALLAGRASPWWDSFYQDRARPCPFFVAFPDESLADWVQQGLVRPGRAIDLGCGNARNAIFLARRGFSVEGVDYSNTAIEWARERITDAGVAVSLTCRDVFELELEADAYDLVYDSGCFHHIAPHRRKAYVDRLVRALKPGGWLGLTCFTPEGGSGYSDDEVYEHGSMGGGLGYTEPQLRQQWSPGLQVRLIRRMRKPSADSALFGEEFLWALLAEKDPA